MFRVTFEEWIGSSGLIGYNLNPEPEILLLSPETQRCSVQVSL